MVRMGVIDIPNARSSHTRPTPRAGGLACLVGVLASGVAADAVGLEVPWPLIGAAFALAMVGLADDSRRPGCDEPTGRASRRRCIHRLGGRRGVACGRWSGHRPGRREQRQLHGRHQRDHEPECRGVGRDGVARGARCGRRGSLGHRRGNRRRGTWIPALERPHRTVVPRGYRQLPVRGPADRGHRRGRRQRRLADGGRGSPDHLPRRHRVSSAHPGPTPRAALDEPIAIMPTSS